MSDSVVPRAFKAAWFAKAARMAKISDAALCKAIAQVMAGQADDLGGGVFKKRLSDNLYRSIILARGGDYWVYEFLFARQYGALTQELAAAQIVDGQWIEICIGMLEQKI
jgi:hypothetical protein